MTPTPPKAGTARLIHCLNCGKPMERGKGRAKGKKFCSDGCRYDWHARAKHARQITTGRDSAKQGAKP